MKRAFCLLFIWAVLGTPAAASWQGWESAAFERARREDKPLLVLVTAFGCYPCLALERDVLAQPVVAQAIGARFVALRVDADEQPHLADALALALRDQDAASTLPLLVALSPDGRRIEPAPPAGEREASPRLASWFETAARPRAPRTPSSVWRRWRCPTTAATTRSGRPHCRPCARASTI